MHKYTIYHLVDIHICDTTSASTSNNYDLTKLSISRDVTVNSAKVFCIFKHTTEKVFCGNQMTEVVQDLTRDHVLRHNKL